jgi:hypothetical protein
VVVFASLPRRHHLAQLNHLNMLRTVHPVVPPAHNDVAAVLIMAVIAEPDALKLKLNAHWCVSENQAKTLATS